MPAQGLLDDIRWFRTRSLSAARLLGLQLLVQGLAAATSFLFIRAMSKEEFGWLTMVTGLLTTMSILSDFGTGAGVQAVAARVWMDAKALGQLLLAAQQTRHALGLFVAVVFGPAFVWLLHRNGAPLLYATGLVIAACVTVWYATSTVVLAIACRMHSRYEDVQLAEAAGGTLKLAVAVVAALVRSNAAVGILAGLGAALVHNLRTRRVARQVAELKQPGVDVQLYRSEILGFLRPLAAPTLFAVFQGQLGVWMLGILGYVTSVADLGALSRFGVLLGIIAATSNQVAGAAFARCRTRSALLMQVRRVFAATLVAFALPATALVVVPSMALRLLGSGYENLALELRLVVILSLANTLVALLWTLNVARGWVSEAWLVIPITLIGQALVVVWLSPATVVGALGLALVAAAATLAVYAALACRGYARWARRLEP